MPEAKVKPDMMAVVERFDEVEARSDYERALKIVADEFRISCADVERLLIENDALNNGNI